MSFGMSILTRTQMYAGGLYKKKRALFGELDAGNDT